MADILELAKDAGFLKRNSEYVGEIEELEAFANLIRADEQSKLGEPVAWKYKTNKVHIWITEDEPPEDAYDEGTLKPLYAKKG